ncbi:hypothetical protein [Terrabacter terrigena]|uniref:Uncharacterized protein n=1 Tax=Terrabacter terrigena TaxID=574718 RepID=A0ABW3MYC4_9MICO
MTSNLVPERLTAATTLREPDVPEPFIASGDAAGAALRAAGAGDWDGVVAVPDGGATAGIGTLVTVGVTGAAAAGAHRAAETARTGPGAAPETAPGPVDGTAAAVPTSEPVVASAI